MTVRNSVTPGDSATISRQALPRRKECKGAWHAPLPALTAKTPPRGDRRRVAGRYRITAGDLEGAKVPQAELSRAREARRLPARLKATAKDLVAAAQVLLRAAGATLTPATVPGQPG